MYHLRHFGCTTNNKLNNNNNNNDDDDNVKYRMYAYPLKKVGYLCTFLLHSDDSNDS